MSKTKKQIGTIGVDAGLVYIVDPCYIKDNPTVYKEERWPEFCQEFEDKGGDQEEFAQMCQGIVCNTNLGDGTYPVYADFGDDGRIKKIEINFEEEPEEEEEYEEEPEEENSIDDFEEEE